MMVPHLRPGTPADGIKTLPSAIVSASDENSEVLSSGCGFSGDADSYGLVVRLGAYIQWLTSVIAYNLYDSEAASMRGVNTCFQVAVFIGLVLKTVYHKDFYAIEAFILLLFCIGGFCCALPFPYRLGSASELEFLVRARPTTMGDLVMSILGVATCAYGVWYVFDGMDGMMNTNCNSPIFVFARVSLYGWARKLLKALVLMGFIFLSIALLLNTLELLKYCRDYIKNWANVEDENSTHSAHVKQPSWKILCLSIVGLALLVVAVELALFWNEVEGVYSLGSTGQVFPLVVGVAGLSRLLWKVGYDYFKGDIQWKPRS
ncbi:hypothetical protein N7540_010851 [Penicillium herquei]|nr:hypothetical protein N7540_010851 [Penicillium herquei]